MLWFFFALVSVSALAAAELIQQKLLSSKYAFEPRTSVVLTFFFQFFCSLIIVLFTPLKDTLFSVFHPSVFPLLLLVSFIASIANIFYLRSFQVKAISISTIIMSSSVVISTMLGIWFFQESWTFSKFTGISFILGAIVFLNYKNISIERNHYYGIFSGILFGICFVLDKAIVLQIPPIIYMVWTFLFSAVLGFLYNPKKVIRIMQKNKLKDYRLIVFSGGAYLLYNFFTFSAYASGGEVGKVDAINNTQTFLIILVEYFVLGQRISVKRKIWTALLAYVGVILLAHQ